MARYFVRIEGEIPVLDSDIEDIDYDYAGLEVKDFSILSPDDQYEVIRYCAERMLGHTGLEICDSEYLGER